MHKGKKVTKKPQNKVGVPQKKGRSEEGKGGEPAVPCRERLQPGAAGASRGQPLPMTKEDSPDSVPHADGHGGRGTGQPKDNGMARILTAPRRSSCWRRAGRSSSPRVLPARTRAVRGKATGDTHNSALQGQTCKLLRAPVRQVGEA